MENDYNKKKLIPIQLFALLPSNAAKFLFMTWILSINRKCYYNSTAYKLYHMSKEDCDLALQTLIDNGIVNVTKSGEWYNCMINYDKFEDFNYPFKDLFEKDSIKPSTDVTFMDNKVEGIINQLTPSEKEEIVKRLGDELASSSDKYKKQEIRDKIAMECLLQSKAANKC